MGPFGPFEMLTVGVIALLVLGPERLPEAARNVARFVGRFRAEAGRAVNELKRAGGLEGLDDELRSIRDEVRGARQDVARGLRSPVQELKDVASGGPSSRAAGGQTGDSPGGPTAARDTAPPVDDEAT